MTDNFSNGWAIAKLEDIVDILDSKRVPINSKEREFRQGSIPYYGATGQVGWIDDFLFDEELVLLGEDGAPFLDPAKQKAYVIRGKSWVNNHAHVLRAKNGIPNAYIKYYLDIVDYHNFVTGTTRLKLNQAAMRQIPVPVAPPDQQNRIVAEIEKQFSRLDEAVANLKRVKANLKRYKAAVLKAAVEGRLVETEAELARREGRSYETGEQLLQRILETRRSQWKGKGKYKEPAAPDTTDLPELPQGWVWASLDAISTIIDSLHKTPSYVEEGFPMVRVTEVRGGVLDLTGALCVTEEVFSEFTRRYRPKRGDIVLSRVGSYGNSSLVSSDQPFCLGQNTTIIAEPAIVPTYLHTCLESDVIKRQIDTKVVGSSQKTWSLKHISELSIPIPSIAEQQRIVAEVDRRLTLLRATEAQVNANLNRSESLRKAVLRRNFIGGSGDAMVGDA